MAYPLHNMPDLAAADLFQPAHFPLTLRMQRPGGHLAASQYMPQPFGLSSQPPTYAQRDVGSAGDGYPASLTDPPVRSRKRKAATLRLHDWAPYRERILELYETETLSEVKHIIAKESGGIFNPGIRQYQTSIRQWKKNKNVQPHEMKTIVRKLQQRRLVETDKAPLEFHVRDKQVGPEKIARWMKSKGLSDSLPYAPTSPAFTPPDLTYHTISEPSSPAALSTLSPVASIFSPESRGSELHRPQISSPTLSISSTIRSQLSVFAEQSATLASQALVLFQDGYALGSGIKQETGILVRSRYRADEEEILRDRVYRAEISINVKPSVVFEMLYSLAKVLLNQGRYKDAEPIAHGLVLRYVRQSDGNHDEVLEISALYLLGLLLLYQGSYNEAEILHRRVTKRRQMILGPEHRDTLSARASLSKILVRKGYYHEAETMARETLALANRLFSFNQVDISYHTETLFEALTCQARYEEAETVAEEIMKLSVEWRGIEHMHTLADMGNLAAILQKQGKYVESEAMFVDLLASSTKVLGPKHPDTLKTKGNIAILLDLKGGHEEAEAMYKEVLASRAEGIGSEHPITLAIKQNLANCLSDQGRVDEAEALLREVVSAEERVLGMDHPDTLAGKHNLALSVEIRGRHSEAEVLYKEVVSAKRRMLAPNHPDTLLTVRNLRRLLSRQGRHAEALQV